MKIVKDSLRRIDGRQAAMDHYMAGFNAEQRWQNDETEDVKRRIECLEQSSPEPEKPQKRKRPVILN